jgi:hypothetical protein
MESPAGVRKRSPCANLTLCCFFSRVLSVPASDSALALATLTFVSYKREALRPWHLG